MKGIYIGAAALLVAGLAGFSATAAETSTYYDFHVAKILEGTGGKLPTEFQRVTYEVDALGNVVKVTQTLPFELHLEAVKRLDVPMVSTVISSGDVDQGYGSESGVLGEDNWFFCDDSSVFVDQFGSGSSPPDSVARVEADPIESSGITGSGDTCSGFYGETLTWPSITFDTRAADPNFNVFAGAFANHWVSDDAGGYHWGDWVVASTHLEGVLFLDQFCFFGFCDTFDYFLGNGAVVLLGTDGM